MSERPYEYASRAEFDEDAKRLCAEIGVAFDSRYGKAARFLLAVMPCNADAAKIADLTGLSTPTVKKYREVWWVNLCEKSNLFRYDWFKEGGLIIFTLDTIVMVGKATRKWDEQAKDFLYCAIKKQKPPKPPTFTSETKFSARREGLVPMESR